VAVDRFNEDLWEYREELESGSLATAHQEAYDTFFIIKSTPKRGQKIAFNTEAVSTYTNWYAGFQATHFPWDNGSGESSLIRDYSVRELLMEMETLTRMKYFGRYKSIVSKLPRNRRASLKYLPD
jgi:hypothetical protein